MGLWDDFASEETAGGAAGGAAAGASFGPWGAAIGGGLGGLYGMYSHHKKNKVAGNYKADLTAAELQNEKRMSALKQFYMDQQQKALGYYAPAEHMFNAAYGTEGMMPPTIPGGQSPAVPQAPAWGGLGGMASRMPGPRGY